MSHQFTGMNTVFDRENANSLLRRDVITKIFSERVNL